MLSGLDNEMARTFRQRVAALNKTERKLLTESQSHWLRFRAPSCSLPSSGTINARQISDAVPCLAAVYRDRIRVLMQRCEVDNEHSLEEMAAWDQPWSSKVPRGFQVEEHLMAYNVTGVARITTAYNLPSENLPAARRAAVGVNRVEAFCRAIGPDGKRWLASPLRDGNLSYVPESATEPAPTHAEAVKHPR
jgi:hypothetical protein